MNCALQKVKPLQRARAPLVWSIILALLPKCPICYVTLTGSMTICGLGQSNSLAISKGLVAVILAVVVISLLFSFRGVQTVAALFLVIIGAILIFSGDLQVIDLTRYYVGAGLVFSGSPYQPKISVTPQTQGSASGKDHLI